MTLLVYLAVGSKQKQVLKLHKVLQYSTADTKTRIYEDLKQYVYYFIIQWKNKTGEIWKTEWGWCITIWDKLL